MRRNIFLYLFLFALLWIVYQFVYNKSYSDNAEKRINTAQTKLAKKDSLLSEATNKLKSVNDKLADIEYFTLLGNANAKDYFDSDNLDVAELNPKILDGLYALNTTEGNKLISFSGDGRPFQINRAQILNHRWIIADFSDGKNWGEILIAYFINENGTVDYETVENLMYPTIIYN